MTRTTADSSTQTKQAEPAMALLAPADPRWDLLWQLDLVGADTKLLLLSLAHTGWDLARTQRETALDDVDLRTNLGWLRATGIVTYADTIDWDRVQALQGVKYEPFFSHRVVYGDEPVAVG